MRDRSRSSSASARPSESMGYLGRRGSRPHPADADQATPAPQRFRRGLPVHPRPGCVGAACSLRWRACGPPAATIDQGDPMSDEYADLDAVAQADLVRAGEVKPLELVDAAIARAEAVNPQINAIIHERYEKARAEAEG